MARMRIFSAPEQEAFESPPAFDGVERKRFFSPTLALNEAAATLRGASNKTLFLVSAGYFKAERKFFNKRFRRSDVDFVARQIGVDPGEVRVKDYDKETYARHQRMILSHFGYGPFDEAAKAFVADEIARLIRVQCRHKLILLEIVETLARRKIAIPGYAVLADLIVAAAGRRQRELNDIVEDCLTDSLRGKLDGLLGKEPGSKAEDGGRYRLTLLKRHSHSARPSKIKANLTDLQGLQALYSDLKPTVERLGLSYDHIRHYAGSVAKTQASKVSRRADNDRYLRLIAFVVCRTFKLNDVLTDTLLNSVQSAVNAADKECKDAYFQEREQRDRSFSALVGRLRQDVQETLSAIKHIVADTEVSDSRKIALIDAALKAEGDEPDPIGRRLDDFERNAAKVQRGRDYLTLLEARSVRLQRRVADVVRHIQFAPNCSKPALWEALLHYREKDGAVDKSAPAGFLSSDRRDALIDADGKFRVSLYKALLYVEVAAAVKSGALNLSCSEKYRSLDEYLIPKADWEANRVEYLRRAGLERLTDCRAVLTELGQTLDERYAEVNKRIKSGENSCFTARADGTFHVSTPKAEEEECLPLGAFLPERKYISLLEALATVDKATGFLDEFEHWQVKYRRAKPPKRIFLAGIIGYGCDIGHRKLAQVSRQIDENELENAVNWYFSLQNVQAANDRILGMMDRMELPDACRRDADVLHTSSDGQKFEVAVDSLNANYSFKYLGKDKGVSVVTFIDARDLMWHSAVISSSEREAAYVIDGLMHNDVIKSDVHSTDTHGYSEAVFATADLLGFEFAPRIKGVGRQQLYAFKKRKHYEGLGYALLPDRPVNEEAVESQWDEILRFIATIRLKAATASQLFKRLNSYSKQHRLYRALKEFGKIPKTLFILKYADDLKFRQAIERQLNKAESSNKLSKAISYGHNREFVQSEKEAQEIAEACRRLIKNAIVCWNYLYLSRELEKQPDEARRAELIEAVRNGSALTWRHFNLHGEFDFSDEKMADSVGLEPPKKKPSETP